MIRDGAAVRPPVVMGLSPAGGTSTLAAALHADDGGLLAPGAAGYADVLLCRADAASLRAAAALACAPVGPPPVLALATGPGRLAGRPPVLSRRFTAVIALPHVEEWTGHDAGRPARTVLAVAAADLSEPVRRYAAALHRLVLALTGSMLLDRSCPPLVSRPTTGPLRSGSRPLPLLPADAAAPAHDHGPAVGPETSPEPDDEALEAEPALATSGRAG